LSEWHPFALVGGAVREKTVAFCCNMHVDRSGSRFVRLSPQRGSSLTTKRYSIAPIALEHHAGKNGGREFYSSSGLA